MNSYSCLTNKVHTHGTVYYEPVEMEVEVGAVFILIEDKSSALFAVLFNGEEILLLLSDIEKHVHTYIYHVWSIAFMYA